MPSRCMQRYLASRGITRCPVQSLADVSQHVLVLLAFPFDYTIRRASDDTLRDLLLLVLIRGLCPAVHPTGIGNEALKELRGFELDTTTMSPYDTANALWDMIEANQEDQ
jgi:hypothetical protein